jgi:hypothetical protein
MPEQTPRPLAERKYLADANYYRLGYQLVAQLTHQQEANQTHEPAVEKPLDILYGEWVRGKSDQIDVEDRANQLLEEAEAVLATYARRRETRKWVIFRNSLTAKEERLEQFLRRTVNPCLTIVLAASIRLRSPAEAEAQIAPLRDRANLSGGPGTEEANELSYRSLYNLACYEAGSAEALPQNNALRYLAAALERAPVPRRVELARWAQMDPSLKSVADTAAFRELMSLHASPTHTDSEKG